jgi:hypothetical protein
VDSSSRLSRNEHFKKEVDMVNKNIIVTLFVTAAAAAPETGAAQKAAYNIRFNPNKCKLGNRIINISKVRK